VTSDITHIATAVYDQDRTATSRALVQRFIESGYFDYNYYLSGENQINDLLDSGKAQFVLVIPRNFTKDLSRGRPTQVQTLYDGSDANTARVISGYADAIIGQYSAGIIIERLNRLRTVVPRLPSVDGRVRVWYNPELKSVNFLIPGLLTTILLFVTTTLTSTAIVKEKELGTLEQIIVTPITPLELMIGKTVPFLLVGVIELIIGLSIALLWFHIRIAGNIFLLCILSILFFFTTLGLGTLISTLSHTQQESSLTGVFFLLPAIMLSGFIFPIANMPRIIQLVTYLDPLRYYLEIIRGIFLKGSGLKDLWPQTLALAFLGISILLFSASRFSKRLS
jgi:ABC-2 type transport system permease protein